MLPDEDDELRPRENDGVGGEDPLQVMSLMPLVVPQIQYNGQSCLITVASNWYIHDLVIEKSYFRFQMIS